MLSHQASDATRGEDFRRSKNGIAGTGFLKDSVNRWSHAESDYRKHNHKICRNLNILIVSPVAAIYFAFNHRNGWLRKKETHNNKKKRGKREKKEMPFSAHRTLKFINKQEIW